MTTDPATPSPPAGRGCPAETVHTLDRESLELFAAKGLQSEAGEPRPAGLETNGNAVKVRRVMQLTRDLAKRQFRDLRVLDLACGEGVYSIEAGLRGASVLGMDARTERMEDGAGAAARLNLPNVRFEQQDVRKVRKGEYGHFDVIYLLGILYHLDVPDVFQVLENLYEMCGDLLIVDTEIALHVGSEVRHRGQAYFGVWGEEHSPTDSPEARRARLKASLDNPRCFLFTRDSLVRLLNDVGFTTVNLCLVPFEADKPAHRITLVAHKGAPVRLSSYPWVNEKTEAEIAQAMGSRLVRESVPRREPPGIGRKLRSGVNRVLRAAGFELRRV